MSACPIHWKLDNSTGTTDHRRIPQRERQRSKGEPVASFKEQALRRKPVLEMEAETGADTGKSELKRTVGLLGLAGIGIGGTIGTGIFFILSKAVPIAAPAVIVSFGLAAVVAGLTAVCYSELAGAGPVGRSADSSDYNTLRALGRGVT